MPLTVKKRTYLISVTKWSFGDVIAGITVAATSLPQYIAYAELAGLPGYLGVKTSGPPLMAFAFVTGSPCLSVGVTSITALMSYSALKGSEYKAAKGDEAWMDVLGAFSVLTGLFSIFLALFGAASLVSRIPKAVKVGWKVGFALTVVGAQIAGAVFGGGGTFVKKNCSVPEGLSGGVVSMYRLGWTLGHPDVWDAGATSFTLLTLFVVLWCKNLLNRIFRLPGVEVLVAVALSTVIALNMGYSGDVVGMPPPPPPQATDALNSLSLFNNLVRQWPWEMAWTQLVELLGGWPWAIATAIAFAGVNFLAIVSCLDACPPPGGWSPNHELAGQGAGCVVSGMLGSAPIGGSLSRSMVASLTGATTPLMGFVCGSATMLLAFPQMAMLLASTPKAALAAVVLAAVLPSVIYPKDLLKLSGVDAVVGFGTAVASSFIDPTKGFAVGLALHAMLSILPRTFGLLQR